MAAKRQEAIVFGFGHLVTQATGAELNVICNRNRRANLLHDGRCRRSLIFSNYPAFLETSRKTNVQTPGMDGQPSYKAKAVQKYVESLEGRLELHRLPTYSPDLNPDEFVWSHMKNNGVSKKPLKQNESLRQRVETDLLNLYSNPELVRSFFMAPSVAYTND